VAVSSGGSAERSPISPWPSFGQHETIKAPEFDDLKAVPCPSPGSIMSSMPWIEGAAGVSIADLSISTFALTSAGIFPPYFRDLGGQIGGPLWEVGGGQSPIAYTGPNDREAST